jgi:hypothetical protein
LLCALELDFDELDDERIRRAFIAFPWQGGFTAVGFYNQLKFVVPKRERLRIISLRFRRPDGLKLR